MKTVNQIRLENRARVRRLKVDHAVDAMVANDAEMLRKHEEMLRLREQHDRAREEWHALGKRVRAKFEKLYERELAEIAALEKQAAKGDVQRDDVEKFMRRLTAGVDYGAQGLLVVECSAFHLIVRNPGGSYWSGRGQTSYAKACTYLLDMRYGACTSGISLLDTAVRKHTGRLPAATLKQWRAVIAVREGRARKS